MNDASAHSDVAAPTRAGWRRGVRAVLRRLRIVLGAGFVFSVLPAVADDVVSKEYQIKAAYLYNFAKFVEWPAQRFADDRAPLVIGVFGANPFGNELLAIGRDHKINGREIVVRTVHSAAEAEAVQLLFFPAGEDKPAAEFQAALHVSGVLTVGESDQFLAAGGIIRFVRQADKVRFEINDETAEQHGLKISAQLLKLAKPAGK